MRHDSRHKTVALLDRVTPMALAQLLCMSMHTSGAYEETAEWWLLGSFTLAFMLEKPQMSIV